MIYEGVIVKDAGKESEELVFVSGLFVAKDSQTAAIMVAEFLAVEPERSRVAGIEKYDPKTMGVLVRPFC